MMKSSPHLSLPSAPLRNPLCLQRNSCSQCRDFHPNPLITMNTQLPIWSKTPPCKSKAPCKNSHSDNNNTNNEDGDLSKPWTNVDFTLKLTRGEWEHFCNPCVHCWLPLLSFLDAISEREEWVTVLSFDEPSGGVGCELAQKEFGSRCFSGDHDKHRARSSGASILGSNTTWGKLMLKNRTDKESFEQTVHPTRARHPDNPLKDLRKGQEWLHGCWG